MHGAKLDVLTIGVCGVEDYKQPILDHCPNVTELRLETGGSAVRLRSHLLPLSVNALADRHAARHHSLSREVEPALKN